MSKKKINDDLIITKDELISFKTEAAEFEELDLKNILKRPKKYGRNFKLSWEFDKRFSNWLIRSPNNLPFCKYCGIELKATGGTQDLKYHMKTRKHKKNSEEIKRQGTVEIKANGLLQLTEVDLLVKGIEADNYKIHYSLGFQKHLTKNNKNDKILTEIDKKFCKMCGEIVNGSNLNCTNNLNQLHVFVDNSFNIEEEKRIIQFEIKELINKLIDTNVTRTPVQAFCDLLVSDMNKLPDNVQRKIRMNIMQRVDEELTKVEKS